MLKIFLAEDEVVVRETIKRMIPWEELGFELVGEAADGEMALPLLIRQQPDLLITDIKMPFMDGLTLARLAKKEIPGLKVVILSGYDDFNYAKQAIGIGVEDYLLKPITKNALIERLSEIRSRYAHEKTQNEYYKKFQLERDKLIDKNYREHPNTLAGKLIKNQKLPIIPGNLSQQERDSLFKYRYLSLIDFSDTLLLYTPFYTDKIFQYIQLHKKPYASPRENETNYIQALDYLIHLLNMNPIVQQNLLQFLISGFESQQKEEVLAHI